MTKLTSRKYLICVEDEGIVYTHVFSEKFRCGGMYYTCYNNEGKFAHTEEEMRSSIITGYRHAKSARDTLVEYYKKKLPKGERLKVFIKRIYDKDMGMLR